MVEERASNAGEVMLLLKLPLKTFPTSKKFHYIKSLYKFLIDIYTITKNVLAGCDAISNILFIMNQTTIEHHN